MTGRPDPVARQNAVAWAIGAIAMISAAVGFALGWIIWGAA